MDEHVVLMGEHGVFWALWSCGWGNIPFPPKWHEEYIGISHGTSIKTWGAVRGQLSVSESGQIETNSTLTKLHMVLKWGESIHHRIAWLVCGLHKYAHTKPFNLCNEGRPWSYIFWNLKWTCPWKMFESAMVALEFLSPTCWTSFSSPENLPWKAKLLGIQWRRGWIRVTKRLNQSQKVIFLRFLQDFRQVGRHEINGNFRILNWRYLPYVRPM